LRRLPRACGDAPRSAAGADEARLFLAAPAQAGLDRSAVLAEVVAVQGKADLEPQRVTGSETRRGHALLQGRAQTGPGASRVDQKFDPVLARVTGSADEH